MKKYLPQQADEETIKKELLTIVNHEKDKNFGSLMKKALAEFQGRASGAQIAKILREVLG